MGSRVWKLVLAAAWDTFFLLLQEARPIPIWYMVDSGKLNMEKAEIVRLLEFLVLESIRHGVSCAAVYWSQELTRPPQVLAGDIDVK